MPENHRLSALSIVKLPLMLAPLPALGLLLLCIVQGLIPPFTAVMSASFINNALGMASGENLPYTAALYPLLWMSAFQILSTYGEVGGALFHTRLKTRLRSTLRGDMLKRCAQLRYPHLENGETWDLIARVMKEPEVALDSAYSNVLGLLSGALKLLGVFSLLLTQVWWAAPLILIFSAPLLYISQKSGQKSYDKERALTKLRRRYEYLSEVLMGREATEERTLFGYSGPLNGRYRQTFEEVRKQQLGVDAREYVRIKAGGAATALVCAVLALALIPPTLSGQISAGMSISLIAAILSLTMDLSWGISHAMYQLARSREYIKDAAAFYALSRQPLSLTPPRRPAPLFSSLELKNVRFAYPGTDHYVLDGLSLTLLPGRHYAFVGLNGAGKTTITKLITGLYPDFEGEILLNGKPIGSYDPDELKAFYSVVYQDFARYEVSLSDNVALGNAHALLDGRGRQAAESAARKAGLSTLAQDLSQGFDTMLGKIHEGGTDLSGGQWQQVAMARAVASPAPIRILDEPTAALDPVRESELYRAFERISRGDTTLFISHRLGSTRLADQIFVIGGGKLLEQGTHGSLYHLGGEYARMYDSQRSWYA